MSGAKKYDFSAFDEASKQEPKKEYDFSSFDGIIKKKDDGQPLENGGQEKPVGTSPTQSPSQSQLPKVKWEENLLNPTAAVKQAETKKQEIQKIKPQPTPSIKKDGEDVDFTLARNYESAQNSYSLADKQHKDAKQGKTGWALNYLSPIFEDIEEAISPAYKQEKQDAINKASTAFDIESKKAKTAQLALKAEIPKILSPINSDLNSYLDKTTDGVTIPNIYKIDEFAKNTAKKAGLPEDGYFKKLIYNEAKANVANKIIEPEVNNKFKELYKKETGKDINEDLKSDYDKGFIKAQEIKQKTEQTAKQIATDVSIDTKNKINELQTSLTQQVDVLNSEIIIGQEAINQKYKGLIQDNKFVGNQEQYQEYQQDINDLQNKQKQNELAYQKLNKDFINQQHLISTKANARYRRQIEEITRLAQNNIEKESLKYSQAYKQDPKLKERVERLYKQAYGQTISKNEKIKEVLSDVNTPTVNFTKSFISALGGTMKGISTSIGFNAGQTFGDYLENKFQVGSSEIKSLSDIIDPQKMAKSSGQLAGGMLPSMLGSAVAAYATGGESAIVQLTTTGLAGWAGETLDMAGRAESDKFESTGDAVAAKEASQKTVDSQVMLMPLYALEGLPFMEAPLNISKSKLIKAAVGGAIEFGTELPQEYLQNLSEEAIKNDESYKDMFKYHSAEKLKSTALNIAPVFLLGAGGQLTKQSEEEKAEYATQQAAKSFALKAKFADLAPSQREQFLFDVMQRQGVNFASTYLLASYTAGHIDKATFEDMGKSLTKSAEILTKAQALGLNPAQTKILNAFSVSYDKAKKAFDEETDPLLKTIAASKLVDYETQINSLATKKESNYAVVSYPNNEQYLFTHTELENALDNEDFANAISNGDINITLNGDKEKLNKKIEDTKTSIASAKQEQERLLQEKEKEIKQDIEAKFNVQIQDNVGELGVEVQGLGTEEETEQAKQALRDAGIKLREDGKENITGLPSQVGVGQELVTAESQQGAGTEATSTGGVLQTQGIGTEGQRVEGVGEKVTQPITSPTAINISNKTELSDLEERTKTDKNKSAVLESAKKAIATLKSVFPDMEIFIHEDADGYNKTVKPIGGVENSRGNFAFERDENDVPTGKGRIDINLSNASETTVAHEVTHAILLKAFGDSPATFKQFRDKISPILRSDLNEELLQFEKLYEGLDVAPEEYLTQLSALLSKGAETVQYKPSTLRKIAAVINEFVAKITRGKFQPFKEEADFKNFVDFLNQISAAIREGDVIQKLNTQEPYSSGESISVSNPKEFVAKKIGEVKSKAEIGDYQFPDNIEILKTADLPVKNLTDLVRQYNGRVVIITSDATGYGVDDMGQPIFGGFGFSANAKNVNDGIGFASVSIGTVKGTYTAAEKAYGEGKALVLVMIQPPHTTINNSYGSKYIIRGIKEIATQSKEELAKTKEAIKDFIKNSTAIQNELKTNEASLKRGSEKRLIELIDSIDENTDLDAAVDEFIADTTFTIRKELGKGIILENKDIRTNKSTNYAKIALNNVGYNIFDFLKEYGDNTILTDDLILNNTGGYVVGGFELDILPIEQREKLINDTQSKGIVHPLFNAKLPGTNHFRLDGLYDVQENFSEYVRPETVITLEQKERDKLVRKYYKEDKFYKAEYRSIPLNKRTYTQLTIPAKTEFKEKYLRKKGGLVETIPNIATKVAKGEGFIPKPGAAEKMAQAEYKSKTQLPEQVKDVESTTKALENVGEDKRDILANAASKVFKDAGYHIGNLQYKSDYATDSYHGDMPFTGYYFISDPKKVIGKESRKTSEKGFKIVDFSKYNLLKLTTPQYWVVKNALKKLSSDLNNGLTVEQSIDKNSRGYGYSQMLEYWMPEFLNKIKNSDFTNELNEYKKEVNKDTYKTDRLETRILKNMGYEGIDVRNAKETNDEASPDSFSEGSVIFDLKKDTINTTAEAYHEALKLPEQERTAQQNDLIKSVNEALGVSALPEQEVKSKAQLPEQQKPIVTGVEQEQVIKQMKPFTDKMVDIEREFKNNGYEINTDYDNEIQVLDKKGEQVEPDELPNNLKKLAADYEKATMKLGEFDASSMEQALAESRKVVETKAEVVEPKKAELPKQEKGVEGKVGEEVALKEKEFTDEEDRKIKDIAVKANLNHDDYINNIPTGKKNKFGNNINEYEATNPFTNEKVIFKKQGDAANYVIKEIAKAVTKNGREEIFKSILAKAELPKQDRSEWKQEDYKKEIKKLEKEDAEGNKEKIKELTIELGAKMIEDLKKGKEEKKKEETKGEKGKTSEEKNAIQEALNKHEEGEGTFDDFVNDIEGIAFDNDNENLQDAIDAYREEQRYNAELKGRGDMDAAEEAFMNKVNAESEFPKQMKSKAQKAKVDFGEGEEAKDNKKEFDKLTSTIPNSGEVTKYLSGETIEKYEGEKPRNEQEVLAQQLRPALERGVDIIQKAKELFGDKYVENLLQYVETENLPPANKALIYVSLENELAKQKIENPSEAAKIEKMQDLVRTKSQAFLRSSSLAINMGRLRKFAEVGYDVNNLTDRFFSSRQKEDKNKIEQALQATADDINKEAERIITEDENIKAKIDEGVKEEIQKIYENLSTEKKKTVDKRLSVLDKLKQKIFNKYSFKSKPQLAEQNIKSKSSINNIIEEGYNKISNAIKAGVDINKAINIGIDTIKQNIEKTTGQKWADEAEFRDDMINAFKAEGLMGSKKKEKSQEQILKEQQRKLEAEINRQLSIVLKLQEKLARYESGELIESDVREQLKDVPEIEELKQKVKEAQANYNKKIAEQKRIQDNIEKLEKELERVKARKQKTPKEKTSEVRQLSDEEEALIAKIKDENEAWAKEKENAKKLESQYKALETERNRQLERVSILKEKLEALKRGEKPKKNAKEIKLDTPEIEALKADIKKEEKRLAEAEAKREKTIEERLEEAKARVKKQIESIQEQIANKQRVAKKEKLKPDAELENLIKQKDALNALLDKYVPKVDAYSEERNLKAAKARLENEILQLNKQIQKGQKDKFEKKESKENAELDALRAEKEARQAILEALDPTPRLFIENALIEQGFGRQINVKTKDGVEKRWVLDWKKLAGEEGSVDNIRDRVESALIDKGYTDEQILRMQDAFVEEYNNLRQSIVEKAQNEIAARNKEAVTPEQKSAVKKLVEMYNYGLFDKDPSEFETALAKTIGVSGISLQNFERVKELGEAMSNLFNSSFEGQPLNESELRTAIQVIEEKMRIILNSEAMQQGTTAFKLSEIAKGYMDASQRMLLNTIKQGVENPVSGLLERFYSAIGYSGKIPEQLNAQQRKMARDIYKEMVLQKGMGYGNVGNAFISKGSLDAYVHNMSDSELVQGIMSVAMGKTILDAVDSAYKAKITQQKFTYNLIKILTKDRMVNGQLEKGMSIDEAKRYVAEKISGQSFEEAKKTAKDIIDNINTQAGKKIFNDSPEFVSRLATDIVNAALVNGEKITKEMVTAAYNAAYKAAGRGLGHVSNNFISEQINTYSGKLESRINDAIKQKKYNKAAWLNLQAILYRNIINPFVGGGTNWVVLKAEKAGLGLVSGLASMYSNRDSKIDMTSETGMKELEDVMYNSMKTKDKFIRGAVGGAITALAFMLIKATDADDEYEKWIKKNQWAKKYLSIITPEIMLGMLAAKSTSGYKTYLENSFNKNESFDKGKMAMKAMVALSAGKKAEAAGQAGQLLGSSIGTPIPWRLVRDGQQIWVGATGGEPYAINPAPAKSFMEGYLKGGLVDYLGFAPTSEDKTFILTKKDLDKPEYKIYKEKEIKIPSHRSINEYRVDTETGLMNEEQYNKFISLVDSYMENGFEKIDGYREETVYGLKELPEQTFRIKQKGQPREEVLGKDLSKEDLQNKVNQLHEDAVNQAKFDLGLITKKPKRTVTIKR